MLEIDPSRDRPLPRAQLSGRGGPVRPGRRRSWVRLSLLAALVVVVGLVGVYAAALLNAPRRLEPELRQTQAPAARADANSGSSVRSVFPGAVAPPPSGTPAQADRNVVPNAQATSGPATSGNWHAVPTPPETPAQPVPAPAPAATPALIPTPGVVEPVQAAPDAPVPAAAAPAPTDAAAPAPEGAVNLNTASVDDLNRLGAGMIGKHLIANRPYASPDDLVSRKILTRKDFDLIRPKITAP